MKSSIFFQTVLASVLALSSIATGQECQPACCDVLVKGIDDSNIGCEHPSVPTTTTSSRVLTKEHHTVDCTEGGIDCTFGGQVKVCCESIVSFLFKALCFQGLELTTPRLAFLWQNSLTQVGTKCQSA